MDIGGTTVKFVAQTALFWLAVAAVPAVGVSQGIDLKSGAVVLYGSASNTSHPATIDMKKVERKTPEYKTIRSDGVRKGSARYEILVAKMHKRIKRAAKSAATSGNRDCVIRKGDVRDAKGLSVTDLTRETIERLVSSDRSP